jgi:SAM-dependent methyltransferase
LEVIDPVAASGFGGQADAYERGRPSYPTEAVEWLVDGLAIGPGRRVLDLGAGTGKLTRMLVASGAQLVAVEPVAAMRAQFAAVLPDVELHVGTAEAIPLADASVHTVVAAQAFHWFDPSPALTEIARVLRPQGGLGMVWNERDESVPWVAQLTRIIHWDERQPYKVGTDWRAVIEGDGRFSRVEREKFSFDQEVDVDRLVERVTSTSYIAAMTQEERAPIVAQTRALVVGFPEVFVLPYVTDTYRCHLI